MSDGNSNYTLNASLAAQLKKYKPTLPLGFGSQIAPVMFQCLYKNGVWDSGAMVSSESLSLSPSAKIFHYGQQIFEGMKAYRHDNGAPMLFRPLENFKRFNHSAERMSMPQIPESLFLAGLKHLVAFLQEHIPQELGESLYLRPFMIATESGLGLASSQEYLFAILASPSASYFSKSRVSALIEREFCRAIPGGTGAVKVAGNYGSSIYSSIQAKELGFDQTLWLDGVNNRYVEEFSGMNFFAVIKEELWTPQLSDSILPGITRDSILKLGSSLGVRTHEEKIDIDGLIENIKKGDCSEIFACGTAAIVAPVAELGEKDGTRYPLAHPDGQLALKLREKLLQIQIGQGDRSFSDWCVPVNLSS